VYRVAQEALTNAVRHAHCARVEMHLTADDGGLTLHVRDDGAGLGNAPPGGGIRGMRERALMIGGSVSVRNRPRAGVEVSLRVPPTQASHE
ncbi:MAG: ATP-binding protein, partial [Gaiellales bacterium]